MYRYEIWDRTSPVGTIPTDVIVKSVPSEGAVYVIYHGDMPVLIQGYDPQAVGLVPMDEETARSRAEDEVKARNTDAEKGETTCS